MAPMVFDDQQLRKRLDASTAVVAVRQALVDAERGLLVTPPRVSSDLGQGGLIFTAGARVGRWFGYRSYDTFEADPGAQVVVAHDWDTGLVRAVASGNELGPRRTGAIGGVAVDVLARVDAVRLGMIGTGTQAWTQLWAICAVRRLDRVRVWSRDPVRRADFARRARAELGVNAHPAGSAEDAVRDSDIVVLATSSPVPVIDPVWVPAGCHVTTVGPKQQGRAEFDVALAERADVVVTDSLGQARSYRPPFVLEGTDHMGRLVSLGAVIEAMAPGRSTREQVTLFCSVGLAGTEVHLLAELAGSAQ